MAEPLKNMYNEAFFTEFSNKVKNVYPSFPTNQFINLIFDSSWDRKELKERIRHISTCLAQTLPPMYRESLAILKQLSPHCKGFEYLFFPDFVEAYGLNERTESLQALKQFTSSSSAEFAIRPFIDADKEATMTVLLQWASDENEHVRRLASEGCRPRLPWARPLKQFKKDPTLILPILETLKDDPSEYVRKSVANNINDIAKDHPIIVKELCRKWKGNSPYTDWIVKHGCRTLLRKADPEVLELFGFDCHPKIEIVNMHLSTSTLKRGEDIAFSFQITNETAHCFKLRIEYAVDFVKARGHSSRKLFKITENTYETGTYSFSRKHSFKDLSTRIHYPGEHHISIIVNGTEYAKRSFILTE
ncbi:DNA alkylation repair protein [Bacillus sp. JCM 19034]|uniref:DNA alkylation repair protein n=1 Tax=Bacillus sp. JCM 19034 TaxID=1481928 RepID=UPI0007863C19|nr:DNA alkylation repair protein [Bacillus sp. JCM 19034]